MHDFENLTEIEIAPELLTFDVEAWIDSERLRLLPLMQYMSTLHCCSMHALTRDPCKNYDLEATARTIIDMGEQSADERGLGDM